MSHHAANLEIDRAVSRQEAARIVGENRIPGSPEKVIGKDAAEAAGAAPKRGWARKLLIGTAAGAVLAGAAYYGHDYWTTGRFVVSTDDAYVQADSVAISPKISGYLSAVAVSDNEPVRAGQVLARVDDRDYAVALRQAEADVEAAKAAVAAKNAAIDTQQATVASANATIEVDHANQTFAEQENTRYAQLAANGNGTVQNAEQAASRVSGARAAVQRDVAARLAATSQVETLKAELAQAGAALDHAIAVRDQAKLNLEYTIIVAPADGVVGNRTLRVGQYVQAGTQLMNIVPRAQSYVVANFKETQLTDVRPGQPVDIDVDMFPGRVLHGHVDSLSPATGQTFALLPPDNATGNFTKIVQRLPVKIVLDADSAGTGELSPGMSVTPSINTKPVAPITRTAENTR
jgi:membrane fusion protein (multidrug efflux system)